MPKWLCAAGGAALAAVTVACSSSPPDPQLVGAFATCKQEVVKALPLADLRFGELNEDAVTWRGENRVSIGGEMWVEDDGDELYGYWDCRASRVGDEWVAVVTID